MLINYKNLDPTNTYKLMSQTVIPRPIAWIVTEDEDIVNVAPFSYFTPLSSNPATVIVSIGHKTDGSPKDTLYNIRKHKKATICFVNGINIENMKNSATPLRHKESEVTEFNISTTKILDDYPPICENIQTAFFCELYQEIDLEGKTKPLILKVNLQYCDDTIYNDKLDLKFETIGRVGKNFSIQTKI